MTADRQRFVDIYERHHDAVLRYAWRRVGPDHAADIAAETFTVAWRRLPEVPGGAPLPWLYGVARNLIANRARKNRRNGGPLVGLEENMHPAETDQAEAVGQRELAVAAFHNLPEQDRELVRLIAWEGLSLSEAATVLECRTPTVTVRLHRARRRIEKLMNSSLEEVAP